MADEDFWEQFGRLSAEDKAEVSKDMICYGKAFIKDGKRIHPEDVLLPGEPPPTSAC